MAEKRFIKGLFKDTAHIDQPESSWRHARNMLLNQTDGAVSNEGGNKIRGFLTGNSNITGNQNSKVIGKIEVNDDRIILFVTDVVNSVAFTGISPKSEIGMWEKGVYRVLYNPTITSTVDLNFKQSSLINGTFKIDSKGDLVIYWTDDLNPPRAFNVDRQLRSGGIVTDLYGIVSPNSINLLNLFPYAGSVPTISLGFTGSIQEAVTTGGGLRTGVYYLALAYVDDDLVSTNFLTVSNPVSIVDEYDSTRPITKKNGAKAGDQTSKSITWRVSNLNSDYSFLKAVVIRKMGDATDAFQLKDISPLPGAPFQEIMFSGLEGSTPSSVDEIIIDTVSYDTVKTINQLDGVLYLGNTTGSKDLGYQKYANNIKLNSVVKTIPDFSPYWATVDNLETGFANSPVDNGNAVPHDTSYRYIPNIENYKGYQRDEIYAFYIAFILKDGSMSYAYHIPGRQAVQTGIDYSDYNLLSSSTYNSELDETPQPLRDSYSEDAKLFHFYDASTVISAVDSRQMQYWENLNETYPITDNFDVFNGITQLAGLQGRNVRHHHFPSNENTDRCSIVSGSTSSTSSTSIFPFTDPNAITASNYSGVFYASQGSDQNGAAWENLGLGAPYANTGTMAPVFNGGAGGEFTSTTPNTTVDISPLIRVVNYNGTFGGAHRGELRCEYRPFGGGWGPFPGTGCSMANNGYWSFPSVMSSQSTIEERIIHGIGHSTAWSVFMPSAGDSVRLRVLRSHSNIEFKGQCGDDADDNCPTPAGAACNGGNWPTMWSNSSTTGSEYPYDNTCSHVRYEVSIAPAGGPLSDYTDVHLKDEVRPLGFELEDIKIPQSIADKIQGFRIYRADRSHAQSTVLGQSIVSPMSKKLGIMGVCLEALTGTANPGAVQQSLGTLGDSPEWFVSNDPWADIQTSYLASTASAQNNNGEAYSLLAFYDFNLLRTKASLVPATHMKLEYIVGDFTWNGPELEQDKKMLTEVGIGTNTSTGAFEVIERWGWDTVGAEMNCYPKNINSAIFMGGTYVSLGDLVNGSIPFTKSDYELNRPIGQKAKTYLRGDSIFNGTPLGFGGKISNLGGESNMVFKMEDGFELPSLLSIPDFDGTGTGTTVTNLFGVYQEGFGSMLTNTDTTLFGPHARHYSYITNLKAYKTDVYKSIDTQELVWTGFEVVGDDLENFVFDNAGTMGGTGNTVDIQPEGIFGGDIFLNRQGVIKSNTPSNSVELSNPKKAIYYHTVESKDNIDFRHSEDEKSEYFPGGISKTLLKSAGTEGFDYGHMDNLKYNDNYSTSNSVRPAFPLPLRDVIQTEFSTRTHRSAKNDTTSLIDNYRVFLANQFKDLPKNRGELWKLSSFSNLLYFHMEDSLFAAKGKQSMSMKDGSEAFVGSGDIFQQDPDEIIQTSDGYGGTQSHYAALTTRYGYFFVNSKSRKIFLMKDKLQEISKLGINTWFEDNISFEIDKYLAKKASAHSCLRDNPVLGFGFYSVYDPKHKRIILTKREKIPTQEFIDGYEEGLVSGPLPVYYINFNESLCAYVEVTVDKNPPYGDIFTPIDFNDEYFFTEGGWTISYYPELNVWGSFHDYIPYLYFNTSDNFYSLTDQYERPCWDNSVLAADHVGTTFGNAGIWEHNNNNLKGILYQENNKNQYTYEEWLLSAIYHPFEFEFIHNETKNQDTLLASFNYTLEVFNLEGINILQNGFTKFFLYNTFQISADTVNVDGVTAEGTDLEYLINTRRIGNNWKVNRFRDMAAAALNNTADGYYMSTNVNVTGGINIGTVTTSDTQNMFIYNRMFKDLNLSYLDLSKAWNQQRKFIDKWVGIRLIYDNISNNLVNLYSTNVDVRKMHR